MFHRAMAASIAALSLITCQAAYAATDCWSAEEAHAARLQGLNTLLMIEALKCEKTTPGIKAHYEAFSARNHEAIVRSKHTIEDYFMVRAGAEGGRSEYLGYETALANEMSSPEATYARCEDMVSLAHLAASADESDLPALANTLAVSRLIEACPAPVRSMNIEVWDRGAQAYAPHPARVEYAAPPEVADADVEMVDGVPTDIPAALAENDAAPPEAAPPPRLAMRSEPEQLGSAAKLEPAVQTETMKTEVAAADPATALQAAAHALALAADALKNASPRTATAVN